MNIKEAEKILRDYIGTGPEAEPVEFDKAIALGAEALKRLHEHRTEHIDITFRALPRETKE